MKKKKKRILIAGGILVIAAAAGVGGYMFLRSKQTMPQMTTSVQSAQAEIGSISTTVVGTGTLASASASDIKVPVGLEIEEVLVESGDSVTTGQTLATLSTASIAEKLLSVKEEISALEEEIDENDDDTAEETIIVQNASMASLEALQATLEALLEDNTIKATFDGIVDSVNVSEGSETSKTSGSSGTTSDTSGSATGSSSVASPVSYTNQNTNGGFITLSTANTSYGDTYSATNMVSSDYEVTTASVEASDSAAPTADIQTTASAQNSTAADTFSMNGSSDIDTATAADALTELTKIRACAPNITAPQTGATPQASDITAAEYTGTIQWNPNDSTFKDATVYSATVELTSNAGYYFTSDVAVNYSGATVNILSQEGESEGNKITFTLTFPVTASEKETTATPTPSTGNGTSNNSNTTNTTDNNNTTNNSASAAQGTTSGSMTSGSSGSTTSSASGSTASDTDTSDNTNTEENDTHTTTAFSIAPNDTVLLSVSVDELDILSIATGQTAAITFDALEDQEFEGTISSIADSATTSSGGVSKYAVEISLPKDSSMKLGMNASATITVENKENIVLIPVNALQEKGDKTFVYTSSNEETGELSEMVEIETGLSDGDNVEVTSGLSEGTTVYYAKVGVTSSDESGMSGMGGMGNMGDMSGGNRGTDSGSGMGGMSGGEPPSGGGMPQGGN